MSRDARKKAMAELSTEVRAWQSAQDLFDGAVADAAGLNRTDWRCMDILGTQGPMTAGQLAEAAQLTTGAVTGVLDHLESRGFVRRVRDTTDRRRVIVEVSPDLESRASPVFGPFLAESEQMLAAFNVDELATITRFVHESRVLLLRHVPRVRALREKGVDLAR